MACTKEEMTSLKKQLFPLLTWKIIYWALVLTLVVFVTTQTSFIRPTDDAKELILYSACFFFILFSWGKNFLNNKPIHLDLIEILFLVWLVYALINLLITPAPFNEGIVVVGRLVLLALAVRLLANEEPKKILFLLYWLVLLAGLTLLFSVKQPDASVFLPVGHISYFSDFFLLLIPWAISLAWYSRSRPLQAGSLVLAILFFYEIVIMTRRASLIAFMVALLVTTMVVLSVKTDIRKKIFVVLLIMGGLGAVLVLQTPTWERLAELTRSFVSGEIRQESRYTIAKRSLTAISEAPLQGHGYGSFRFVYSKYYQPEDQEPRFFKPGAGNQWLMHPHNEILFQLFEGGIVGCLLLSLPFIFIFVFLLKQLNSSDKQTDYLILTLVFAITAFFTTLQFNTSGSNPVIRAIMIPSFALAYRLAKDRIPSWSFEKLNLVWKKWGQIVLMLLFLGIGHGVIGYSLSSHLLIKARNEFRLRSTTSWHHWALYLSPASFDFLTRSAEMEINMENPDRGIALLEKAKKLYPYVPHVYFKLASLYESLGLLPEAKQVLKELYSLYPFY